MRYISESDLCFDVKIAEHLVKFIERLSSGKKVGNYCSECFCKICQC